jgi:tRNA(Ile)-lysidine synthase
MPKKNQKRNKLAERLCVELRKGELTQAGLRVGVAVSGGADSVALLLLLLELRQQLGIVLSAVHFNHKLRGKASDSDEKFVAKLAAQHGLRFFVEREDIAGKAKRERANLEDAARRGRYAFFEGLVASGQLDRVAVAHTADDQAETVLAHMLRGTGLAGLGGIHPVVGGVFRPLLKIRRAELRRYLRSRRQSWREDATNRDTKRMRARIRRRLIPLLEKQFQPAVVEHLCQLAELAREDEAWLENTAELQMSVSAKEGKGEWRIAVSDLLDPQAGSESAGSDEPLCSRQADRAMSKRMVRLLAKRVKPRSGQLSSVHVGAVLQIAEQPHSGKSLHLPGGVEVRRAGEWMCFRAMSEVSGAKCPWTAYSYPVELGSGTTELRVGEASCGLRFTVIDWPPEGRETRLIGAVVDRDVLGVPLVVRNWRPGDALQPLSHQKRHKLSRLLNELGVSRWDKVSWPVLVSGGRIAWARGLPVATEFAAGSSTRAGVVITEVPLTER